MDHIIQVLIFFCGISSMYLVGRTDKYQKYGFLIGLLGQPFWIYTSFLQEQVGIFLLATGHTFLWARGFYNHWFKSLKGEDKPIIGPETIVTTDVAEDKKV